MHLHQSTTAFALRLISILVLLCPTVKGQFEDRYRAQRAPLADPEAPDQSQLLSRSKDPEFILRNFKTMFIQESAWLTTFSGRLSCRPLSLACSSTST